MMIKKGTEYFDFDGVIEVESRIKLFEDISTNNGDFSYDIELPNTAHNRKLLGIPVIDSVKSIYTGVSVDIINDSGELVYSGKLQVNTITAVITATFYAGNTEWFGLLSGPLSSLPLYRYDIELTEANIIASWLNSSGITLPIIDTGLLVTRSYRNLKIEDFTSFFYVKTLFNEIFNPLGIKLTGDLFEDPLFNTIGVLSNSKSQSDVDDRSSYVNKTVAQSGLSSLTKITFQDESTFPFFDGAENNFSSSTYTADVKMNVAVDISLIINYSLANQRVYLRKNGSSYKTYTIGNVFITSEETLSKSVSIPLNAGDTIDVYIDRIDGVGTFGIKVNSFIKITPTYIYKVFGKSSVPNWSKADFVSNILRVFNTLVYYDTTSKTLTIDLFNKIKSKDATDVSEFILIDETDYSQFISNYAKRNTFSYQEGDDEDLKQYNISNFISYGSGEILVNNDFIDNSTDVVESDFTTPITYLNPIFDTSMERIQFVEFEEIFDRAVTDVTNSSGTPHFKVTDASTYFTVGDMVGIETGLDSYNGEWVISSVTSTYITVNGPSFDDATTGTVTLLRHKFTQDDSVYLVASIPNVSVDQFSSESFMMLENTQFTSASLAYFNILSNGQEINHKFKQGLSFGDTNNPLSYQKTLLDTYWPVFGSILNDPVMLKLTAYFKKTTYDELKTFLRPLRVKTNETNNLYYLNKLSGYKSGAEPCYPELIKL